MNVTEYAIKHQVVSWIFVVFLLLGGGISFFGLGQLEFPEFTLKEARIITGYPGASPQQVEEEVTLPLEEALQQLEYIKHINSVSSAGSSQIIVHMKDKYDKKKLPQIWDELRRKVGDEQKKLPHGVHQSVVRDDYSDVFGILFNITGKDYSFRDLENYAKYLKRELVLIPGVKKLSIAGQRQEQVVLEISKEKAAALGVDPSWLLSLIGNQNMVSNAGNVFVDGYSVRISPTGEFNNIYELEQLVIGPSASNTLIRLRDIVSIRKEYEEIPRIIYRSNGESALSLGLSFMPDVNVVDIGDAVRKKLEDLESYRPIGISLNTVYNQPRVVSESVNGFLVNLAESVIIIIFVLLFAMGIRSGLIMGAVLLLTVFGTFIVMRLMDINLQLISLGALIIALGMLVDNAIVITEGIQIGLNRGLSTIDAAKNVVKQTQLPLLGATIIAVIAFAPIGLSEEASGEFCVSLFQVLLISLMLSWVTAITLTPFLCHHFLKASICFNGTNVNVADLYPGALFRLYKRLLSMALKSRTLIIGFTICAIIAAAIGLGFVKNVFFPPSSTPIFFVDFWMPQGVDIRFTEASLARLEKQVIGLDGVNNVTTVGGMGAQRFILTYSVQSENSSYGQLIIEMSDLGKIDEIAPKILSILHNEFPDVEHRVKRLQNGPSPSAEIEARFYGEDPVVLRSLAAKTMAIFRDEPLASNIRHGWRNRVGIVRPQLDEFKARRSGISKRSLDDALLMNFTGKQVGTYREGSYMFPIIVRAPKAERDSENSIKDIQVWSSERKNFVPITQAVSNFKVEWEDSLIVRRERKRMISVMADPDFQSNETTDSIFHKIKAKVEVVTLPEGYNLEWGGSYEKSTEAQKAIFSSIPMGYLLMFLITVLLFNTLKQSLAIWCTVPLALIGVVAGLLLFDAPLSFVALLGFLSLSGMLIKNGIVLVDQIKHELDGGRDKCEAIFYASVSRARPVCMAALTTMLGMTPLLFDAFFKSMAVTIIFGLGFASVLTLIVLPVIYSLFYNVSFKVFIYER